MRALAALLISLSFTGCTVTPDDFLGEGRKRVHVEVMSYEGQGIDTSAVAGLKREIETLCRKPVDVRYQAPFPNDRGDKPWSVEQLDEFIEKHATLHTSGDTVVLYVVFVPGTSADDQAFRGIAWRSDAFALFSERYTQTTLKHEFGHVLGLTKGRHRDMRHKEHCRSQHCIMWWQASTQPEFCPLCLEEVAARRP